MTTAKRPEIKHAAIKRPGTKHSEIKRAAITPATPGQVAAIESGTPRRYAVIDVLRGFAILLMIAYHFCFDLKYYGWIQQDFNNSSFWLGARAFIVSLFLLLVGISLVLNAQRADTASFWRREAMLLAACVAVSIGSFVMFPESFIFFGILHFILLASLAGRGFVRFYHVNLVASMLVLLAGTLYTNTVFNTPSLQWLGFMTYKPVTEDYVPFFPWFGIVLAGIFLGRLTFEKLRPAWLIAYQPGRRMRYLAQAGRHSLVIYLLHQPVLLGILSLVASS